MKLSRKQLRRLIESALGPDVMGRGFLESVRQSVKSRVGTGTYLTLGTNESGVKGVLIRSKNPSLISFLKADFPGKTVEYYPRQDGGGSAGELQHNINVLGTDPLDTSVPADIVVEAQSGDEIQGQISADLGGDRGLFLYGSTYFVGM